MKKYNSWMVLGPGRTGSLVIVHMLFFSSVPKLIYRDPDIAARSIDEHELIHTHNLDWLNHVTDSTGIVISIRNPIESALSWCILPKFGKTNGKLNYHFFKHTIRKVEELQHNIVPFTLPVDQFLEAFNHANSFYEQYELQDQHYIIEYEDWCDQPGRILDQLELVEYSPATLLTLDSVPIPLKNPGSHSEWISNWAEIERVSKSLSLEKYTQLCQRKHWQRRY
jgi:hypothetical protein